MGRPNLLLVAILLIEGAARGVGPLSRRFETMGGAAVPQPDTGILAGVTRTLRSPYLLGIAGFIFLYTLMNTFLYFEKTRIVAESVAGSDARAAVLGSIDFWANLLTLVVQLLLTGRLLRGVGAGPLLILMPIGFAAAFLALGLWPSLTLFIVLQTVLRAANYALAKPARETLFTVVPPGGPLQGQELHRHLRLPGRRRGRLAGLGRGRGDRLAGPADRRGVGGAGAAPGPAAAAPGREGRARPDPAGQLRGSRPTGMVMQRQPPPPRASSEPSMVTTQRPAVSRSTLPAITSAAGTTAKPARASSSTVWVLRP